MVSQPGESRFFRSGDLKLHYLSWGDENVETVVLLHGIRGYAKTWVQAASTLSDRFRVIALDQRGRGASDWSPTAEYYTDAYVADLEALSEHLDVDQVDVLGHSLGGANALVFAHRHPEKVRRLIVEDIGPGSSNSGKGASRVVNEFKTTPASFANWQDARKYWRAARPQVSDAAVDSRVSETLMNGEDGRVIWRFDFEGIKAARLDLAMNPSRLPDLWPCVDSLNCPTLLLRGAQSDFLPRAVALEMAVRNSRVELLEIANATHYVHDDNFVAFSEALNSFLRRD
jgi:pimeloyl-ACP methyl ester carboxylesterase